MAMDVDDLPPATNSTPSLTEDLRHDTPRFADLSAHFLHPLLTQAITDDLRFQHMMPVQAATLWELLPPNRRDCLVQAKTGTGKTVAFLLPALQTMVSQKSPASSTVSLLVVSPTRELALQIAQEATRLLQRLPNYRVCTAIGGTNRDKEKIQILNGCDVLVATPGRLVDHMSNEHISNAFGQLDTLVLDEADTLLDMGFMPTLREIVRNLPSKERAPRQSMLFSATVMPHVSQVAGLVLSPGYKSISTIPTGATNTHEHVAQMLIKVPTFASVLAGMVSSVVDEATKHENYKAIVFAPTAALAGFYGHILSMVPGLPQISSLQSRMRQNKRTRISNKFRIASSAILVATDLVARGMDFPGVTTVFQIGIPLDKQSYVHRLGRTGRANAEGRGIFLICEAESFFPNSALNQTRFIPHEASMASGEEVHHIAERMDEKEKIRIYKSWLAYYRLHLRGLGWGKEELVSEANRYAADGLGSRETPPIPQSIVQNLGLTGTKGLNVVPDKYPS
ncbi:ATP-dependent RNA helicase [Pochonia chlamydosporia 170]|uniref:ATP-dependent RNA helicase n=1 Tax=Pochonia chlamydosporia 170 TaxID=1380566 RepID=A0A179FUB9_METCM|nr:ATP-dependent RNA helicase [Pochonia chlamydosporia 170]OAQ69256.1 ATP-dependent RNA helicase [Pochonia chlamydosporia 170]